MLLLKIIGGGASYEPGVTELVRPFVTEEMVEHLSKQSDMTICYIIACYYMILQYDNTI